MLKDTPDTWSYDYVLVLEIITRIIKTWTLAELEPQRCLIIFSSGNKIIVRSHSNKIKTVPS